MLALQARAILFLVFEKFTCASLFQIALIIIWLPILRAGSYVTFIVTDMVLSTRKLEQSCTFRQEITRFAIWKCAFLSRKLRNCYLKTTRLLNLHSRSNSNIIQHIRLFLIKILKVTVPFCRGVRKKERTLKEQQIDTERPYSPASLYQLTISWRDVGPIIQNMFHGTATGLS